MNVSTMRVFDRWLGLPACVALSGVRYLADAGRRIFGANSKHIRRILFVKMAEQGATVLAYPALKRAVEMVGRENVYFLVFEENRFILDVMDVIPEGNVIAIKTKGLPALFRGTMGAIRRMRKLKLDAAMDFEFFARSSAALAYLSGARSRVGLHGFGDGAPYRGDLMTHRLKYDPKLHTSEAFSRMVEAVNLDADDLHGGKPIDLPPWHNSLPAFTPGEDELAELKATLQQEAGTDMYRPLVLLNANASDLLPLRRWSPERYVGLARRLLDHSPDIHIAFTGAPGEAAAAEQLVADVGDRRCFSMAGKTTLRQLLVLYYLSDVLVTNDSGPAHFATLTPIHTITLFGPETPALFGARTPRTHILWKGLGCSPCVSAYNNRLSACRDNKCMQQISVDEVFETAMRLLPEKETTPILSPFPAGDTVAENLSETVG